MTFEPPRDPVSIELFAGGGGMALGLRLAGFKHAALVEIDSKACATLTANAERWWPEAEIWDGDVRQWLDATSETAFGDVDVVAGGPPCQPFSLGGLHNGDVDSRNMFPAALDVVRKFQPKAFIFENVPGLMRPSFRPYFDYILAQLREPTLVARPNEPWFTHADRLASQSGRGSLAYNVEAKILNSADYGVPQTRRRVFIIGVRSDLTPWNWDQFSGTHSEASLTYDKWVEPTYWDEHGMQQPPRPSKLTDEHLQALKMKGRSQADRWQTVRDMLRNPTVLPEPLIGVDHPLIANHVGIPGARSYPGHTGSPIDLPAKTIKAGVHGVCGGEAMIRFPDDSLRYLSVRESARVQSFPDGYKLPRVRSTAMRQIGNAVAVDVAQRVSKDLRNLLSI